MTINILTLKVGDKYSADYVNNLYKGIERNSSVKFHFYCYTEDSTGLLPDINIVTLPDSTKFKKQWHKLIFHKTKFGGIKKNELCLILDIDWIIVEDMDPILRYELPKNSIGVFERWWSNRREWCKINGGFQMFYMGDTNYIWEEFIKDPEYWTEYYVKSGKADGPVNGEQNFIEQFSKNKHWLPKEWFAKYHAEDYKKINKNWLKENKYGYKEPYMMGGNFADVIKMVHFSNAGNLIHNAKEHWVKDYWY